eukprot:Skav204430  [mRNA]  locus=scaffold3703:128075:128664:+ [translate_table: standard]
MAEAEAGCTTRCVRMLLWSEVSFAYHSHKDHKEPTDPGKAEDHEPPAEEVPAEDAACDARLVFAEGVTLQISPLILVNKSARSESSPPSGALIGPNFSFDWETAQGTRKSLHNSTKNITPNRKAQSEQKTEESHALFAITCWP